MHTSAYQRLVGKLIYLIIIQPDILIVESVMAQFMRASRTKHSVAVHKILRYNTKTRYFVFFYQYILCTFNCHLDMEAYMNDDWVDSKDR